MNKNKLKMNAVFMLVAFNLFALTHTTKAQNPVDYTLTASDVTIEDGVITACSYDFDANTEGTNLVIPDALEVTGIIDAETDWMGDVTGNNPFCEKNITSITLPSTLTKIGAYSFVKNNLSEINIPAGVSSIGRDAFLGNSIGSLVIPASVRSIGVNAFYDNATLDTVIIEENSKLINIGSHAFVETNVDDLKLPAPVVPDNNFEYWVKVDDNNTIYQGGEVVSVHNYAFIAKFDYTLTAEDITVENGIITACSYDFSGKYIVIPSEIDGQTVTGIIDATSQKNALFYAKGIWELTLPSTLKTIGDYSFNSNSIDTLIIPSSLESIGQFAFWGFSLDTVMYEPNCKLTSIGYGAFDNNSKLKMVFPSPEKGTFMFNYWEDDNNSANTFSGGDEITDFKTSYTAHFYLPEGTPVIDLSGELNYSDITNTTSGLERFTIKNIGNSTLTISDIIAPDTCFKADWTTGDIEAGKEKTVKINFDPTVSKTYKGFVKIVSNASFGIDSIAILAKSINEVLQSVADLDEVNVANGTLENEILFPSQLGITTDGNSSQVDISSLSWTCDDYNANVAASYSFEASIESLLIELSIDNEDVSDSISVEIIVAAEQLQSIASIEDINVEHGTEVESISFPSEVEVTTDVKSFNIDISTLEWTSDAYNKDAAGTYIFTTDMVSLLEENNIDNGNLSTGLNVNVIVPELTIVNNKLDENVQVYPNPVSSTLFIKLNARATVELYDIAGKKLKSKSGKGIIYFDLNKYERGSYFATITSNNTTIIRQIVKQ